MADTDHKNPVIPTSHAGVAPGMQLTPEQNAAAARAAQEQRQKAQQIAKEGVEARAAATKKQVEAYYEQEAEGKPTPTTAEIDLAKVGALDIDAKEDDGSGPERLPYTVWLPAGQDNEGMPVNKRATRAMSAEGSAKYKTK